MKKVIVIIIILRFKLIFTVKLSRIQETIVFMNYIGIS